MTRNRPILFTLSVLLLALTVQPLAAHYHMTVPVYDAELSQWPPRSADGNTGEGHHHHQMDMGQNMHSPENCGNAGADTECSTGGCYLAALITWIEPMEYLANHSFFSSLPVMNEQIPSREIRPPITLT